MENDNVESKEAKGGKARAENLTPEERKNIAQKGALARWEKASNYGSPKTIHPYTKPGILHIGDMELPCAVLSDRTRVITESSIVKKLGRGLGGKSKKLAQDTKSGGPPLPYFLSGKTLEPFIPDSLRIALNNPIQYRAKGGVRRGVNASLLPEICEVWLNARDAGALQQSQLRIAKNADILMRGLAHVGITALVDEATGYQEIRDRDELHKILEAYISKELLPWTKRFPDEFYQHLFRLKGWQYAPLSVKRPKIVGKLTNELIYQKLPDGVLEELRGKNPINERGYRRYKHFQFLTEDIGNPHLEKQVAAVTTLMKASSSWASFQRMFDRVFGTQSEMIFPELEEGRG